MGDFSGLTIFETLYNDLSSASIRYRKKEISDDDYLLALGRFSDLVLYGTIPPDLLAKRKHPRCRPR